MKIVLAIAAIMLIAGFAQASTLKVCPTGCNYTSIQTAVYAAHPNDTIEVYSAIYNESVILTKNIKFEGIDTGIGDPFVNGDLNKYGFNSSIKNLSFLSTASGIFPSKNMVPNTTLYLIESASEIASKSPAEGMSLINKVLKTNPNDAFAWFEKGLILHSSQRYEESIEAFNESLKLDRYDYMTWDMLGMNLYYMKKYNEAIHDFDHAIELNPKFADGWNNIGNLLYQLSKYDDALNAYNQTIQINPKMGTYWHNKGAALKALNRTTEADAAFLKAKVLGYKG